MARRVLPGWSVALLVAAMLEAAPAVAVVLDGEVSDPAPVGSAPLLVGPVGVTALAGRVLSTDGVPLGGVRVSDGSARTETDADGRYLLTGLRSGESVLVIDGRRAVPAGSAEAVDHGLYETRIAARAGETTALGWVSWLPVIDHAHEVAIAAPATAPAVVTTPGVPGLELRIPAGAVLTDTDGKVVTHVGITPIPVNRPPFPLPRNVSVPVYFTAQPGGAVIGSLDGTWLGMQVVYPNYHRELPKARATFWSYEPDSFGWTPYGQGTVTADASQVVPSLEKPLAAS